MKQGFTLIEVLTYVAILTIIVLAISSFFLWTSYSNAKAVAQRETFDNSQRAMEIMTYEIREAKSIYTPTTTSNQLSLETTHYLPTGEISSYIDFYICDERLCIKRESQDPIALTSERVRVINLSFSQIATAASYPSLQIHLQMEYKAPANKPQYQSSVELTSTVSLRSY